MTNSVYDTQQSRQGHSEMTPNAPPQCREAERPTIWVPTSMLTASAFSMHGSRSNDKDALHALAKSIASVELLNPITVWRPDPTQPADLQVLAGWRRVEAVRSLGHERVAAIVYEGADYAACFLAENLQRQNLNPLEKARAISMLKKRGSLTDEELAERLGKSRSAITQSLGLLALPESIQEEALRLWPPVSRAKLVEVAQCSDAVKQAELWDSVRSGATRDDLRVKKAISGRRATAKMGRALSASIKAAKSISARLAFDEAAEVGKQERQKLAELKALVGQIEGQIREIEKRKSTSKSRLKRASSLTDEASMSAREHDGGEAVTWLAPIAGPTNTLEVRAT